MITNFHIFLAALIDPFYWLFFKDPCQTCLVRACCSDPCEIMVVVKNHIYPHENLKEKKKEAWVLIYSLASATIAVIAVLIGLIK